MKRKNLDSSKFQEKWASYKIETLHTIVKEIRELSQSPALPEWQKNWFKVPVGEKDGDVEFLYRSWDEFYKVRKEDIETFLKNGMLGYSTIFYEDILDDEGIYKVIEQDCLDLIRIIKNFSYEKHGDAIFEFIEDNLQGLISALDQIYGQKLLRWEQKQARSGSGIGQKIAREKRISALVESLQQYVKKDSNEIRINWRTFEKLIDQTFKGMENYPRHPDTKRKYREEAQRILGKKIVIEGKRRS